MPGGQAGYCPCNAVLITSIVLEFREECWSVWRACWCLAPGSSHDRGRGACQESMGLEGSPLPLVVTVGRDPLLVPVAEPDAAADAAADELPLAETAATKRAAKAPEVFIVFLTSLA